MRPPRWLLWAFAGIHLLRLGGHAGRLDRHRDRPPALAGHRLLRTADAVGDVSGAQLGASLTGYAVTYGAMLIAYMVVLTHLAGKGAAAAPRCGDDAAERAVRLAP